MADRRPSPTRTSLRGLAYSLFVVLAMSSTPLQAALSYTVGGDWPNPAHRAAAESAAQLVVNRYNSYGDFGNANAYIYYNAGIPTAQASYLGSIGFGGTYPNERVMAHEMAHYLGLPSGSWGTLMSGGSWDGAYGLAKVRQLDGEQATLNGDGAHFWPYGLNYDSEGSELNKQRQVELVYAMRADLGIGPSAPPGSRGTVNLTADNPVGESGFNFKNQWNDGHTPHAGAVYYSGDFLLRTPASANSFKFYGGPLVVNNTDGTSGGLQFNGQGAAAIITIDDLRLDGGWVQHTSAAGSRFQLDGQINVVSNSVVRAKQGNIDVLANVIGAGDLTIETTDLPEQDDRYVRFRATNNAFVGNLVNQSRFELAAGANFRFAIGPGGSSNAITGPTARATILNGAFDLDLSAASFNSGDSWALVTAANTVYGSSFHVPGFTNHSGEWSNGGYSFDQATGLLTLVPTWDVDGGGTWSQSGNWIGEVPPVDGEATFGSKLGAANAPANVVVDTPVSLHRLTFDNPNQYVLMGANPITLTGGARIVASNGSHRIGVPIGGSSGLAFSGDGSVELTASNPFTGDTNIHSGTLRLSGAGTIAGSVNVHVHRGATLDVAGLSTGLELVGGQTLDNHKDGVVVGSVLSMSGATIAGSGKFVGNVTSRSGAVLRIGGVGLPSAASVNGQNQIDDFQSYAPGKLNAGVTGGAWTGVMDGTDNARVVNDAGNNALEYYGTGSAWRGARTSLRDSFSPDDYSLADGEQATYFFRVQRQGTQTIDGIFGLTDLESVGVDAPWQELAVTMSLFQSTAGAPTALRAFDGDGGGDVVVLNNINSSEWINVWLVVDNQNKTYQVATSRGADDGALFPGTFQFGRQSALGAALDTFAGAEFRAVPGTRNSSAVRIDDLYFLPGSDLMNPLGIVGETLTIDGDLTLAAAATLQMDVAEPGTHDTLVVTGAARLSGVLEIDLEAGFALSEGNAFDLFDFAATIGSFDLFDLPTLGVDLRWDVSQLAFNGTIAVAAGRDGDFNADGVVDAADYTWWRDHLGAVEDAVLLAGNGSEDGIVNTADYLLWKANFGQSAGGIGSSAARVPEPQAYLLLVIGILGAARLCQSRRG